VKYRRTTKLLLLEDDPALGEVGEIIEVRPGHARNYLIPSGIATPVTQDALRRVERARQDAAKRRADRAAKLESLRQSLENVSLTLEERASEEGHLFGSVGAAQIVAKLSEQGIELEEKQITLEHPLKELGIFNVPVRLDPENSVEIRVWVVEPNL